MFDRVRDAAGRSVRLARSVCGDREHFTPTTRESALSYAALLAPLLLGGLLYAGAYLLLPGQDLDAPTVFLGQKVVLMAGPLAVTLITLPVGGVLSSRILNRVRVRSRLAVGCCPSCLYELKSLSPDLNGVVICPECGSAWRASATPSGRERG